MHAILALVTVGNLCGCRHQEAVADWGRLQTPRFLRALGFTRDRSPCASTFHEVFSTLDVEAFEAALRGWSSGLEAGAVGEIRAIAIDGKTARGTVGRDLPGVHVLSAFDLGSAIVLASTRVDEKTNEAKRAETFVEEVDLDGALVTGDAAFAQRRLCRRIRERNGDFLFAVKGNQPALKEAIELAFDPPDSPL